MTSIYPTYRPEKKRTALVPRQASDPALLTAVAHWIDATTPSESARRRDIRRDKETSALSFFSFCGKSPAEVTPSDAKEWQAELESRGLATTTVYTRVCHLPSFFRWLMKDPALNQVIRWNPVSYARQKAPKPYQTRGTKAITKKQTAALLNVAQSRANSGDLAGKLDYAMLLLYLSTGMWRSEVINLRGRDLQFEDQAKSFLRS